MELSCLDSMEFCHLHPQVHPMPGKEWFDFNILSAGQGPPWMIKLS